MTASVASLQVNGDASRPRWPASMSTRVLLLLALAPALAAVFWYPGFVTQDGPAHQYNAWILARSLDPTSPLNQAFQVRWDPLPNWAGHLAFMAFNAVLAPRVADRCFTALTAILFAWSTLGLRLRVVGSQGRLPAIVLTVLLALNVTWILGFGSFLLGAALFPLTLDHWWTNRNDSRTWRRGCALGGLVVVGYFCHLVSLGLTVLGIVTLELFTPAGSVHRRRRLSGTVIGLAPLLPLGLTYRSLMSRGGAIAPEWKHLTNPGSLSAWVSQLTWVDPLSLARKDYTPILGSIRSDDFLLAPAFWVSAAIALALVATIREGQGPRTQNEQRGWWILAIVLLVGGVLGPDTLGPSHGEYLQQRVVLLGLASLLPILTLGKPGWLSKVATLSLALALALQTAIVWDYGAASEQTAGVLLRSAPRLGRGQRIATFLTNIRTPFRANPLLHADCALGVGPDHVLWSNYETRFYYFPVQFRGVKPHPNALDFEKIALLGDDSQDGKTRIELVQRLLNKYGTQFDLLLVWNPDSGMEHTLSSRFQPVFTEAMLNVYRPR